MCLVRFLKVRIAEGLFRLSRSIAGHFPCSYKGRWNFLDSSLPKIFWENLVSPGEGRTPLQVEQVLYRCSNQKEPCFSSRLGPEGVIRLIHPPTIGHKRERGGM